MQINNDDGLESKIFSGFEEKRYEDKTKEVK